MLELTKELETIARLEVTPPSLGERERENERNFISSQSLVSIASSARHRHSIMHDASLCVSCLVVARDRSESKSRSVMEDSFERQWKWLVRPAQELSVLFG